MELLFGVFALLGAVDYVTGKHLKIGDEFEKGIMTTGTLVLSMVGMIVFSPLIAKGLTMLLKPFADFMHMDISVVAGFIASDAGGAAIARELTESPMWIGYNGVIVGSMLSAAICIIPVALRVTNEKYHGDILNGLLCGIATIPIGCIVGGLMLGCPVSELIINSLPVILVSAIVCAGLVVNPVLTQKIFGIIGSILQAVLILGLGIGIFEGLTKITIIPGLTSIGEAMSMVCNIALVLAGVFPMLAVISKIFKKVFVKIGSLLGIDDKSVLGIITTLANAIPMLDYICEMNCKGRIMNMAFAVSAAYVIGDHLAFTMVFDSRYVPGMMVGKLVSGIASLVAAHFLYNRITKRDRT